MSKGTFEDITCNVEKFASPHKTTLLDLQDDANLWYKIHVLIYDLSHIKSESASESRTLCTIDELYISSPYFTASEAAMIKGAVLESSRKPKEMSNTEEDATPTVLAMKREPKTVEEGIKERLASFFDKRRASRDSRPCGPHDMAPIYESVFNIKHSELEDAQFLRRLRRSGLDCSIEDDGEGEEARKEKKKKKRGKKRR